MDELNQHKRIDDFLMDRLDLKERAAFQQALEQDADLRREVDIRKIMLEQIDTMGDLRMKDRIRNIQSTVEAKKTPVINRRLLLIVMVAIAAALAFFFFNQFFNQTKSPEQLFATHYQPQQLNFGSRSTNPDEKSIAEAGAFYQQKKYAQAITAFENLNLQGVKDDRVDLGLAISYLETDNTSKAINLLKNLAQNTKNLLQDQAKWYLALAYLKTKAITESEILLLELSSNPTTSQTEKDRAATLLRQLKALQ